jgi:hypothetical protein
MRGSLPSILTIEGAPAGTGLYSLSLPEPFVSTFGDDPCADLGRRASARSKRLPPGFLACSRVPAKPPSACTPRSRRRAEPQRCAALTTRKE